MSTGRFQHARILIVDDEIAVIDILRRVLAQHGYAHIEGATDPFDVVRVFNEWQPDLVVLDLLMPGLDGLQVLEQLRSTIPPDTYLPILVVTAHPSIETRREALAHGASDFIAKPYDRFEIVLRVDNLVETRFLHLDLKGKHTELERRVAERTMEITSVNIALRTEIVDRQQAEEELRTAHAELDTQVRQRTSQLAAVNAALVLKMAERRRAQVEAEQANRAKSEFLSRMSHELRTPLNAILGFGQLLKTGGRDADRPENIDQILSAGHHLLALVDEVLDIAQAEAGVLTLPGGAVTFGAAEKPVDRLQHSGSAEETPAAMRASTVLYIEDNLSNLRLVERIFVVRPGITLVHAAHGQLGLELARERLPDLVLLDLHLPDIHGEHVLEDLVRDARTSAIPVVIISADATPGQVERLTAGGARAYLTKPLDVGRFLATVDRFVTMAREPAIRP